MNLPELLNGGNGLATSPPKTVPPSEPEHSRGKSFFENVGEAAEATDNADHSDGKARTDDASDQDARSDGAGQRPSAPNEETQSDDPDGPPGAAVQATGDASRSVQVFAPVLGSTLIDTNQAKASGQKTQTSALPESSNKALATVHAKAEGTTSAIPQAAGEVAKQSSLLEATQFSDSEKSETLASTIVKPEGKRDPASFSDQTPKSNTTLDVALATRPLGEAKAANQAISRTLDTAANFGPKVTDSRYIRPKTEPRDASLATPANQDEIADLASEELKLSERRIDNLALQSRAEDRALTQSQAQTSAKLSTALSGQGPSAPAEPQTAATSTPQSGLATSPAAVREAFVERSGTAAAVQTREIAETSRSTAIQIAAAIKNQPMMKTIELSLDPPELGRIEIQMEMAEMGMRATLAAERSATGDIIRRQSELLLQQLDDAGFSDVSLDFQEFGSGNEADSEGQEQFSSASNDTLQRSAAPVVQPNHRHAINMNGMDVRL